MAPTANLGGNFQAVAVMQGLDLMFGMAVGAGGSIRLAGGYCLTVNTLRPVFGFLIVARAAGFRLTRKTDG